MTINSYINFPNKTTREALNFYKDCLNAELAIMTIRESPIANELPVELHNDVMHGVVSKAGVPLVLGGDMMRDPLVSSNNVSLMLNCDSEKDAFLYFSKLGEGGTIRDELGINFWGGLFGALTDKYGINWSLHFDMNQVA